MTLKNFLKSPDVQDLLEMNNLIQVYRLWSEDGYPEATLTLFFLDNGIDPLEYMTEIPGGAFSHLDITSITIPHGVTHIGNAAFSYCHKLTCVTLPNIIKTIGGTAFFNCYKIKTVIYEGSKEEYNNISIGLFNEKLENAEWIFRR